MAMSIYLTSRDRCALISKSNVRFGSIGHDLTLKCVAEKSGNIAWKPKIVRTNVSVREFIGHVIVY